MKILPLFLFTLLASAQPSTEWVRCLGGTLSEHATNIKATSDGGCIVIGTTSSDNGDITDPPGYIDFWIVKLSTTGTIQWQKTLGSLNTDYANAIEQTSDGGYIFTGMAGSSNGDVTPSTFGSQIWVVKLNSAGDIQWQNTFGGSQEEYAYSIRQTTDGGYVVAGSSSSADGGVTGNHGNFDVWIIKLSGTGTLQWQKSYGGNGYDEAYSIRQTSDGGYIVAAYTESNNGNVTGFHGFYDIWVLKLNALGNLTWQKTLGGSGQERPNDIIITNDNNYLVAGMTMSIDGDATGNDGVLDAWVIKLNPAGVIQWQKTYGGAGSETATGVVQTANGFAFSGITDSSESGDITGSHPNYDAWVFETDLSGTIQWQKYMGTDSIDAFKSIDQTAGGNLIMAGSSMGTSIEGAAGHGSEDYLVVKLKPSLAAPDFTDTTGLAAYPNPVNYILHFSNGDVEKAEILDIGGRLLYSRAVYGNSIDLQGMA
ncbi:MAG: T9SS C-terminal target domain-containing protein, partial [Sphingobacteriales bacterium]